MSRKMHVKQTKVCDLSERADLQDVIIALTTKPANSRLQQQEPLRKKPCLRTIPTPEEFSSLPRHVQVRTLAELGGALDELRKLIG